jgi:hypothetical protein
VPVAQVRGHSATYGLPERTILAAVQVSRKIDAHPPGPVERTLPAAHQLTLLTSQCEPCRSAARRMQRSRLSMIIFFLVGASPLGFVTTVRQFARSLSKVLLAFCASPSQLFYSGVANCRTVHVPVRWTSISRLIVYLRRRVATGSCLRACARARRVRIGVKKILDQSDQSAAPHRPPRVAGDVDRKGDVDWLPPAKGYRCAQVRQQIPTETLT